LARENLKTKRWKSPKKTGGPKKNAQRTEVGQEEVGGLLKESTQKNRWARW